MEGSFGKHFSVYRSPERVMGVQEGQGCVGHEISIYYSGMVTGFGGADGSVQLPTEVPEAPWSLRNESAIGQ
jgi:putative transposon-encoded protein